SRRRHNARVGRDVVILHQCPGIEGEAEEAGDRAAGARRAKDPRIWDPNKTEWAARPPQVETLYRGSSKLFPERLQHLGDQEEVEGAVSKGAGPLRSEQARPSSSRRATVEARGSNVRQDSHRPGSHCIWCCRHNPACCIRCAEAAPSPASGERADPPIE